MNFYQTKKYTKGFTLIELLVVIAIIGIISAVVLSSLSTARAKSRDAKRISDLRQIRSALELYRSDNGAYPTGTTGGTQSQNSFSALTKLTSPKVYIGTIAKDPKPNGGLCSVEYYCYSWTANGSSYTLGAQLETTSVVVKSDSDASSGSYLNGFADPSPGGSTEYIYDVRP